MRIAKATAQYEAWLGQRLTLVRRDLRLKHERMREDRFAFLHATYYRWAQRWPDLCPDLALAPRALAVGDLHVENFGTWRDAEGRLVWGINDFDEAWRLPFTHDLVRLATSANLAIAGEHLAIDAAAAAEAILDGYRACLDAGGRPFVLAESHETLRAMATQRLHEPGRFWEKLDKLPTVRASVPTGARRALDRMMPQRGLTFRIVHRISGLGSLGRQRYVGIADWHGGSVAREAKALAPSACCWAEGGRTAKIRYRDILAAAVRCRDPFVRLQKNWIVRRLAPDCSRIELAALPRERDHLRLLQATGWETANVHLGSIRRRDLVADLRGRPKGWLARAARVMENAVSEDWADWRRAGR
ncbi:MAG TPA: DUF2252 family protein [Gemmatimonadales bacterium]|nr:DUF2252 family protein [Gemmatimonadales bacterium]